MKPNFYPYMKDRTLTDLTRTEKIHRKNIEDAQKIVDTETEKADEVRREINFRNSTELQEMRKNLYEMKKLIENHTSGKSPLSKTRLAKVERAIAATEDNFNYLLLHWEDLRR